MTIFTRGAVKNDYKRLVLDAMNVRAQEYRSVIRKREDMSIDVMAVYSLEAEPDETGLGHSLTVCRRQNALMKPAPLRPGRRINREVT
jgi:hypothetical protein